MSIHASKICICFLITLRTISVSWNIHELQFKYWKYFISGQVEVSVDHIAHHQYNYIVPDKMTPRGCYIDLTKVNITAANPSLCSRYLFPVCGEPWKSREGNMIPYKWTMKKRNRTQNPCIQQSQWTQAIRKTTTLSDTVTQTWFKFHSWFVSFPFSTHKSTAIRCDTDRSTTN